VVLVLFAAESVTAAASPLTTTTPLSSRVPWPLGTSARSATTTTATVSASLPYTGDNLLPEAIGAILLIGAGVAIRLRPRWR
jgi:hypothetical protein